MTLQKSHKPHSDEEIRSKKAAEKKKALESIKKRQEEARLKHEKARERAQKITTAKQHLRAIAGEIKMTDILALINEENKDIEEVASSTIIFNSLKPFEGKKSQKNPISKRELSLLCDSRTIVNPETLAKVIQIDHDVKQTSPKKGSFKHSILPSELADLNIHETYLPAMEIGMDEQPDIDYALLFGDEQEIFCYMKNMVESTQRILSQTQMNSFVVEDEHLLIDESDIGDPDKYFENAKAIEMGKSLKFKMPPQINVQLRGSQPPRWFPGYYSVLPLNQQANIQLSESESTPLQYAWQQTKPDSFKDGTMIILC